MTAATAMHLSDETVAAYLDKELDEAARDSVMKHLASCHECRSKAVEVSRTLEFLKQPSDVEPSNSEPSSKVDIGSEQPAPVRPPDAIRLGQKPKNRWRWAVAAVAAVVVVLVLIPLFDQPGIPELVAVSKDMHFRKAYGRLSGGFPFKPTDIRRGPLDDKPLDDPSAEDTLLLYARAGEVLNGNDLHAKGVMALLLSDRRTAVPTLQKALENDPGNRAIQQDLAVALLQRAAKGDEQKSLDISNSLWAAEKTREVAWNRAYALQNMDRYEEAVVAWDEYLKLDRDPESPWREEAISAREGMQEMAELSKSNP